MCSCKKFGPDEGEYGCYAGVIGRMYEVHTPDYCRSTKLASWWTIFILWISRGVQRLFRWVASPTDYPATELELSCEARRAAWRDAKAARRARLEAAYDELNEETQDA